MIKTRTACPKPPSLVGVVAASGSLSKFSPIPMLSGIIHRNHDIASDSTSHCQVSCSIYCLNLFLHIRVTILLANACASPAICLKELR